MPDTWEPANLVRELPEEECWPLTARNPGRSLTAQERWRAIEDLCQTYRGEVCDITGSWSYRQTPVPAEDKYFHA